MVTSVDIPLLHVGAIVMINVELDQACPNNSSDSTWLFNKLIVMK